MTPSVRAPLLTALFCIIVGCDQAPIAISLEEINDAVPLFVSSSDLDIGTVWLGSTQAERELKISNNGSGPIRINGFERSCKCLSVNPSSLTIPANTSRHVRVTIAVPENPQLTDPQPMAIVFIPSLGKEYDDMHPPVWKLTGTWRRLINLSRDWIRLSGQESFDEKAEHIVTVESTVPLDSLEIANPRDEHFFSVKLVQESATEFILSVAPMNHHEDSSRPFSEVISLVAHLGSGEIVPVKGITVEGRTFGTVVAIPESLNFGLVDTGIALSERLAIRSVTNSAFRVDSASSNCEDATVHFVEQTSPSKVAIIELQLVPRTIGRRALMVEVHGTRDDDQRFDVQIPLTYFGRKPDDSI